MYYIWCQLCPVLVASGICPQAWELFCYFVGLASCALICSQCCHCPSLLPSLSLPFPSRGYRGGSPTAVRPSNPALCGSCPLVTPYYCRLGDLLCLFCVYRFVCALLSTYICIELFSLFSLSFVDLPSVLWYCWLGFLICKNRLPYNLYCVGGDVKHCSLTHSPPFPSPLFPSPL